MLPQGLKVTLENTEGEMPSKTYKLDLEHKRISGTIDGQAAMLQAVRKIFETERFAYEIYTAAYGIELESLMGQSTDFVSAVLESRIKDALLADARILRLEDFQIVQPEKDVLEVSGTIITTQGNIGFREELRL